MLSYAGRCLAGRRALWAVAAACALLAALPGALFATALAPSAVALLLSGDPLLAGELLPGPLGDRAFSPLWWTGAVAVLALALALWSRLYAVAVWLSDERNEGGVRAAWSGTRRSWSSVFRLYVEASVAVVLGAGALLLSAGLASGGTAGLASLLFVAAAIVLLLRTVLRIALTLAIRAAVFNGMRGRYAWRAARAMMSNERRRAFAAWVTLVGIGAAVWIVGRLVTPVLQDTALDYPHDTAFAFGRELGQLLVAVPLETFLLALSLGVWTAVYRGIDEPAGPVPRREGTNPWLIRGLAALVGLALLGNAVPTFVERAYIEDRERSESAVANQEINAIDALRSRPAAGRDGTTYGVHAELDDDTLSWSTTIDYVNDSGEPLDDIGVNVYAAAYARPLTEMPFARDLLAIDLSGTFRSRAAPGTFALTGVEVDGTRVDAELDDTALVIPLPRRLEPGEVVRVKIDARADLPEWPERFGVWQDMTLLGNWIPTVAVREEGAWRLDRFGSIGDPFFSDVADYDVRIEVDDNVSVVGTGVLTGVSSTEGERRVWRFEALDSRDAAYAAAPFLFGLEESTTRTLVRTWYRSPDRERARSLLDASASAVADYSSRFGRLPFDEVEIVLTDGLLGGMEYPGVVFASAGEGPLTGVPFVPDLVAAAGFDFAESRYIVAHEIAHQWWYAAVGSDQVRDPWLDEALAELSARTWLRSVDGDERAWKIVNLRSSADPIEGVLGAEIDDFGSNSGYTDAVYVGGSEVLLELRRRTGTETFDRLLATWYDDQVLGIADTDDFIETTRRVAGEGAASYLEGFVSD